MKKKIILVLLFLNVFMFKSNLNVNGQIRMSGAASSFTFNAHKGIAIGSALQMDYRIEELRSSIGIGISAYFPNSERNEKMLNLGPVPPNYEEWYYRIYRFSVGYVRGFELNSNSEYYFGFDASILSLDHTFSHQQYGYNHNTTYNSQYMTVGLKLGVEMDLIKSLKMFSELSGHGSVFQMPGFFDESRSDLPLQYQFMAGLRWSLKKNK